MQQPGLSDKKRILCVDGNEDNRLLMVYKLQRMNYESLAAATMIDGLALAMSSRFDLYILDYWYNDGTGVQLCEGIRRFDDTAPILFFSAWTPGAASEEAMRAGAIAYILKPALDDVLLKVRTLLADAKPHSLLQTLSVVTNERRRLERLMLRPPA
jgi:two-component system, OmpR family, response regulator